MNITRSLPRFVTITFALHLLIGSGFGAVREWAGVVRDIKVGRDEQQVRKAMDRYKQENWQSFTNSYHRRLGFLHGQRATAWLLDASTLDTEGGETYIIGVFSEDKKLTDLLCFKAALDLRPIVRGTYAQRLESIKKGMTVDDIYRLLGEEMPFRYYRDKPGGWTIEFSYQGTGPDFWIYEADAGSGIITKAWVSSI